MWIGVKNKGLVIVQVGNTERESAFKAALELVSIAGFEVHEEEIALRPKNVVHMIPVIEIVKRIAGIRRLWRGKW